MKSKLLTRDYSAEEHNNHQRVHGMIVQSVQQCLHNEGIQLLSTLNHTPHDQQLLLQYFGDRYSATLWFDYLLTGGKQYAEEQNLIHIWKVFQENLHEELGREGDPHNINLAHETWRQWLCASLGFTKESLKAHKLQPETQEHSQRLSSISLTKDPWYLLGVLLFIEKFIPKEFKVLQRLLDKVYPDIFTKDIILETPKGDLTLAQRRQYIDDHIVHDEQRHYRDAIIAAVITMTPLEQEEQERILCTIHKAAMDTAACKTLFYAGIARILR